MSRHSFLLYSHNPELRPAIALMLGIGADHAVGAVVDQLHCLAPLCTQPRGKRLVYAVLDGTSPADTNHASTVLAGLRRSDLHLGRLETISLH